MRRALTSSLLVLGLAGCELNRDPNAWNVLHLGWKGSLEYSAGAVPRILEWRLRECMIGWGIPQEAFVVQRNSGTAYLGVCKPDPDPMSEDEYHFSQFFFIMPGEDESFYTITAIQGSYSTRENLFYEAAVPSAPFTKPIRAVIRGLKKPEHSRSDCLQVI